LNSIFDSDGASLTVPTYLDYYHNLSKGNTALTLNAGYGSSLSATNPSLYLLFFYRFFKPSQIPFLLMFGEAVCLGLSGLFMTLYLTHRKSVCKANVRDFRLLSAAFIYSMNAYMLAMHSFPSWYFALCLFPLVMLGMDWLMSGKNWLLYVLTLALCMIFNIQLALYMCIFLVAVFFTFSFDGIKDFIKKGIRFASFSLLSGGIGFYAAASTVLETSDSVYHSLDQEFPHFGFHTNFLDQWKKFMLFCFTDPVTSNEGDISIYLSILALFFVMVYFLSQKYSLRQKLSKLALILFLCISFNGKVLSYLWNGLHYQVKCPNRFVFLFAFLIAELAFDGFLELYNISLRATILLCASLAAFFAICQYGSDGNPSFSFFCTIAVIILYSILIIQNKYRQGAGKIMLSMTLTALIGMEMCANMLHSIRSYGTEEISLYSNYESVGKDIHEILSPNSGFYRICYPSVDVPNLGMVYNTPSSGVFNSYVTNHQKNLNEFFGFYNAVNCITANYDSTPLGNMLAGNRYLFIHNWQHMPLKDLAYYKYLGNYNDYFIFENKYALSLGYYVPNNLASIFSEDGNYPGVYNDFVKQYIDSGRDLFETHIINYDETGKGENTFSFTDAYGKPIDFNEAQKIYDEASTILEPVSSLYMKIKLSSQTEGCAYLYSGEFAALGNAKAGKESEYTTIFPDQITSLLKQYPVLVLNQDVLDEFYKIISSYQLTDVNFPKDAISGTTDYPKEGYTMFSLAYDRNWHAYIDGKKVKVEDPLNSCLMVKTPAGKHTITLKYIPYGMKACRIVSLLCLLLTLGLYFGGRIYQKKKRN
jgi:uncharacterized membrane protein YfhO